MAARAGRGRGPILLIGATGQIGWELRRTLAPLGPIAAPGRDRLDLADRDQLESAVRETAPALVVNAAAYTDVDGAEEDEDTAMTVNGAAPGWLAEEAARRGIALVHYSTDYVFGGDDRGPGAEGAARPYLESDPPAPVNAYGRTKLAGEQAIGKAGPAHLIFRTGWVYAMRGRNFLLTVRRLAREQEELRIVRDQIGAPTWARMVAEATAQALARGWAPDADEPLSGLGGLYHLSAAGETSWHGFAEAIVGAMRASGEAGLTVRNVTAVSTPDFPRPARRSAHSVLDNGALSQAFGIRLPDWETQLRLCLQG
jgi:dTDP-4-dehydrorhamnose reductase